MQRLEDRVASLLALIEGGNGVAYERSVRGRLHTLESTDLAERMRAEAMKGITLQGDRRFSRSEKLLGLAFLGLQTLIALATLIAVILLANP